MSQYQKMPLTQKRCVHCDQGFASEGEVTRIPGKGNYHTECLAEEFGRIPLATLLVRFTKNRDWPPE